MTSNSTFPAQTSFAPLGLDDIIGFAPEAKKLIALGLCQAGEPRRVEAMLPSLPLEREQAPGTGEQASLDMPFLLNLQRHADERLFDAVAELATRRLRESEPIHPADFGDHLVQFALCSLEARRCFKPEAAEHFMGKALAYARSELSIHGLFGAGRHYRLINPYSTLADLGEVEGHGQELLFDSAKANYGLSPAGIAMACLGLGDARLFEAMKSRPDFEPALRDALSRESLYSQSEATFGFLRSAPFWKTLPEQGRALLKLCGKIAEPNRDALLAMIEAAENNPQSPAFLAAREWVGDDLFALAADSDHARSRLATIALEMRSKDATLDETLSRAYVEFLRPRERERYDADEHRADILMPALFGPDAHSSSIVQKAFEIARPNADGAPLPPGAAFAFAKEHLGRGARFIDSISKAGHLAALLYGLEAVGPEEAMAYPGHGRYGLDPSLAMRIAKTASPAVFEAALDWFDKKGILDGMASAKAWVHASCETRKKGDLLAFCVAEGSIELARVLLAKRPALDRKSAREAAKALSQKADALVGAKALASWESLLFADIFNAAEVHTPPAASRKSRSL